VSNQFIAKRFLSEDNFQWLIVLCCQLIFIGFVGSRALASIGMIALLVSSLLFHGPAETFTQYFQRKELLVLSLFFWIVLLSGFYSDDKSSWLNWVRIKLPYIALPLAFAPLQNLKKRQFLALVYGFILILCISACAVLVNYGIHFDAITESFLRGNAIPMPYSHIRYTLMLAFAFFCCWFLLEKKGFLFHENERWLQVFLIAFLFVALHVLTVRSSLFALYIGICFLLLRVIFKQKRFLWGSIAFLFIALAPSAAYKLIPSLKNKVEYMRYDMGQYDNGEVNNLSDGVRLISMKGGLEVAKENLWLGIGAGDLKTEMNKFYSTAYPQLAEVDHKLPHNQFVWTLATTGIVGLAFFLFAFSFPLFTKGNYRNWLLVVLHLILFSSFFTEATFEEQIGTGFYLTFLLVLMNQFQNE
jgi:O-antigen ligase